jgi:hypothetical protein
MDNNGAHLSILGLTAVALGSCCRVRQQQQQQPPPPPPPPPRRGAAVAAPTAPAAAAGTAAAGDDAEPPPRSCGDGSGQLVLVTGATGKVGQVFVKAYQKACSRGVLRALCNNRMLEPSERLQVVKGAQQRPL